MGKVKAVAQGKVEKQEMQRHRGITGVIITVYVESSRVRSLRSIQKTKQIRSHAGDRKAQILAYAQELRRGRDGGQKCSSPQAKKWKWLTVPLRLKMPWTGECQRLACDSEADKGINQRRRKRSGRDHNKFWRKLKRMLRRLTHGWQCFKD
ncbi:hypothetical protein SLE2022_183320 [Rubroshorea leprosula]